ncbi:MAG TPA: efflux RND transporter periplasmic adaptor subunit [Gammaproteobacteria bacterium]|nr:efflux RND transporter periplasmic adaptor subunit [Gammaproteobacteria bacterium]
MTDDQATRLLEQLSLAPELREARGRRGLWLMLAILVAAGAGLWWWRAPAALPVDTAAAIALPARAGGEQAVLDATGYVTARRQATVSAKLTGRVAEVLIEEGQRVRAGEVLARLDPSNAEAELALARSRLAAAEAQLADLEVQRRQAERDARRAEALAARKLGSTQAAEDARVRVASFAARLAAQREQVQVAAKSVDVAAVMLDDTVVRAPFDGVITDKAAQPGEIVSPVSAGGGYTRTGIGTIVDMDSLEIEVDVNESYISRVAPGQAVTAKLNAYPDWDIAAHVITIVPTADRAKATVKVRIALDVHDARIVPEMGVHVGFLEQAQPAAAPESPPSGVLVPAAAIVDDGDRPSVWLFDGERARRREVVLGQQFGANRQVVSGLAVGERVILAPPPQLVDGRRVRERKAPP